MVSKKKIRLVKEVEKQLEEYPVVGLLNMHKLPARQLAEIREKLRGKAVIRMVKKRLILRVLENRKLSALDEYVQGEPALFLSKEDPFKIAKVIQQSTSEAPARPGDVAPREIEIKAGPTSLSAGPVIGELQKVKIPAGVEGEKITIKKDTVLAKEGDIISQELSDVLLKLSIQPMEIRLNLLAAWEDGVVYNKDILFIPSDYYINELKSAVSRSLSLSIHCRLFTPETIPVMLSQASQQAEALTITADIVSPSSIGNLLAKAAQEAKTLKGGAK
ncbi:MAG: 50S ribosomal protein L10 [Candidatus Aenigmarchaeota archaeon]|nr:50S ribosomal protein L10 [Candidatus Aenigmarchaeota archaeon]